MNILVIGPGRIGSTFALHLSLAGHRVAVLARGARLEALRSEGAVVAVDDRRGPVEVLSEFDGAVPYDLVLVTVLAPQADALLPALTASAARCVMPMFNTFDLTKRWRDALGPRRFAFGFPNMSAFLVGGKLRAQVSGAGRVTTLTSDHWGAVFKQAGLPTEVEHDMDSFLRSHVALVVPLMVSALWTWKRGTQLRWSEARRLSAAWAEGFGLVQSLGHTLKPGFVALLARRSNLIRTAIIWAACRASSVKDLGAFGPHEVRQLIDAMASIAPERTMALQAIRP